MTALIGLRIEGRVGTSKIPPNQITFGTPFGARMAPKLVKEDEGAESYVSTELTLSGL
ncbi:hypothetical protein [Rhodopseudomonas boonkerdii]|uniref:hypothetical protein n=1 Tax=Rhodopseudomonas boonkerdii TaxID=475937 RepID=UPI001E3B60AA|nr:hypothetical protein [Rhodopseudomonas boonkerdii]